MKKQNQANNDKTFRALQHKPLFFWATVVSVTLITLPRPEQPHLAAAVTRIYSHLEGRTSLNSSSSSNPSLCLHLFSWFHIHVFSTRCKNSPVPFLCQSACPSPGSGCARSHGNADQMLLSFKPQHTACLHSPGARFLPTTSFPGKGGSSRMQSRNSPQRFTSKRHQLNKFHQVLEEWVQYGRDSIWKVWEGYSWKHTLKWIITVIRQLSHLLLTGLLWDTFIYSIIKYKFKDGCHKTRK